MNGCEPGSIKAGVNYVNEVLSPFRGDLPYLSVQDAVVIDDLVCAFAGPIEREQILPGDFLRTVVGVAALVGISLTNPDSPKNLVTFGSEVAPFFEKKPQPDEP